jgi:hypothetical protein
MRASPGAIYEQETQRFGIPPRDTVPGMNVGDITKKPARRLAFPCPKAGEELLLRAFLGTFDGTLGGTLGGVRGHFGNISSSRGSSSRGGSRSGSSRSGSSGSSTSSRSGGRGSGVSSLRSFSGLRSFSSGLRRFDLGRLSGLRGFGLAASGNSQGEEGGYEERLLHFDKFLNVMELIGQLVDRNVSISISRLFYHGKRNTWCTTASCWTGRGIKVRWH